MLARSFTHLRREVLLYRALLGLLLLTQVAQGIDIFVVKNGGTDNTTCVTGGESHPCADLGVALEGLMHYNHSTVWVSPGAYDLNHSDAAGKEAMEVQGAYRYLWMVDIAILALFDNHTLLNQETMPVKVSCRNDTGLAFIYATNITIRGVEFSGCGAEQYSSSKVASEIQFYKFYTALYFLYAFNITLESVSVAHSLGTGVVMYATSGRNTITKCSFSFNSPKPNASGGGGLYIEFPYCAPKPSHDPQDCSLQSNIPQRYVEGSIYTIETCNFLNNTARIQNESDSTFILPHWETHLAFGRGAGLSVFFKGFSKNNHLLIKNSTLVNNKALWGAGLFVEHQDMSYNNTFIMESSSVENNHCFHHSSEHNGTGGGGARLGHVFFGNSSVSYSRMTFRDVTFSLNMAYYGGGLSLYTTREPTKSSATNVVEFYDCEWVSNVARVGSGVDLSVWHPVPYGAIASPSFTNCVFFYNSARYTSKMGEYVGIGAFYSDSIPVNFHGVTRFESNSPTALACIAARLNFHSDCTAEFVDNSGRNGGAVALMGYSFLQVSSGTSLRFVRNKAEFKGGAIFGQSIGEHDLISSRNCFVRYSDIEVTPWEWNATFYFKNNTVNSGINSIYVTSLLTCLWGGAYSSGSIIEEIQNVFCWNRNSSHPTQWIYSSRNCIDEIATSPAKFMPEANTTNECIEDSSCNVVLAVIPGLSTVLPFYTVDDRDNDVTNATVLTAQLVNNGTELGAYIDRTSLYISDNSVALHGTPKEFVDLKLETIAPRVISVRVRVNFSECPPGMILSDGSKCICRGDYFGLIQCHSTRFISELRRGAWIGVQDNNSSMYVAGECPFCSLFTNNRTLELPQDASDLTKKLCNKINRTGVLCGSCLPDYGPVVNGYNVECHLCSPSHAKYNWVFYLMTEFLPITIFFFVVVLFNVSATSGPANAFVFFAQVLTATFSVDGDGAIPLSNVTNASDVLTSLYVIPYDIWNQNFFHSLLPKFCLSSSVSTLQLLSTGYVTALYPLLLVAIFSSVVWAYGRGVRPVLCLCRPVHKCFVRLRGIWNLQRSIVHALATFIILSYTKFSLVSFILLTKTPLLDDSGTPQAQVLYYDGTIRYMGPNHIPYVIVSFIVLATFVALPPIILSAPSLVLLIKKLYKALLHRDLDFPAFFIPGPSLDQFLNAFHGCYKDGTGGSANNNIDCRWFAALYFVLRLILFLVFAFTPYWFLQYVVQQLVCLAALLIVVIFRPYKNPLFNIVDACIFANLAAISALSMYNFHLSSTGSQLYAWSFAVQYILIFLPLVYMGGYVICILCGKYGKKFQPRRKKTPLETEDAENESFLEYADQEERYRNICGSYQERVLVNTKRKQPAAGDQRASVVYEEEGVVRRGGQSLSPSHNYGSFVHVEPRKTTSSNSSVHSSSKMSSRDTLTRESSGEGEDLVEIVS